MADKLRVGAIGLEDGYWNWSYATFFQRMDDVEFVALAHPTSDPQYLRDVAKISLEDYRDKFKVRLYQDPQQMIDKEHLDAVTIATRYSRQVEFVELAASNGLQVYVTKPMATTLAAAKRILDAANRSKVFITSGMTERSDGSIREAYDKLRAGSIGEPLCIRALHNHGKFSGMNPKNWYMEEAEGGPALSLGWYVCDAIRWLAGATAERLYAEYDNYLTPSAPYFIDNGKILARFANRVMASCDIHYAMDLAWGFPTWEVEIVGTRGALRTTQVAFQTHLFAQGGAMASYRSQNDLHFEELRAWATMCIKKEQSPYLPTAQEAYDAMELCFAAKESARQHQALDMARFRSS